jgi:hypothetical protein
MGRSDGTYLGPGDYDGIWTATVHIPPRILSAIMLIGGIGLWL